MAGEKAWFYLRQLKRAPFNLSFGKKVDGTPTPTKPLFIPSLDTEGDQHSGVP